MIIRQEFSSLRQGLLGAWCPSLGATGYSVIDRSGRNNHGTFPSLVGSADPSGRSIGLSLSLNNQQGASSSAVPLTGNVTATLAMWAKGNSNNGTQALGGWGVSAPLTGFHLFILPSGVVAAGFGSGNMNTVTGALPSNILTHIAITKTPGAIDTTTLIYLNGYPATLASSGNSTSTPNVNSGVFRFGTWGSSGAFLNSFFLDDIRVYNRALTPAEILTLASRRGIGLSPIPDRAAGLPRKLSVNVGGTWRDGNAYVNTGSGWRLGVPSVNVGGTFR